MYFDNYQLKLYCLQFDRNIYNASIFILGLLLQINALEGVFICKLKTLLMPVLFREDNAKSFQLFIRIHVMYYKTVKTPLKYWINPPIHNKRSSRQTNVVRLQYRLTCEYKHSASV